MHTRAVVIPAAGQVELRDVELKPLGADDVLVRTRLTSISAGTERMLLRGVMPHPMLQFPVVPGYETVGQVIDAGERARVDWQARTSAETMASLASMPRSADKALTSSRRSRT